MNQFHSIILMHRTVLTSRTNLFRRRRNTDSANRQTLALLILLLVLLALLSFRTAVASPPPFKPFQKLGDDDWADVGPSSFQVTPAGEAIWSLPIWAPVGRNNIEPHLAINYRSRGPSGLLGLRFTLSGLSSIRRCWGTPAQDGHYSA